MDALARLDEYLVQTMEAPETTEGADKPRFTIETKEQAIWALRKIAAIERARNEARQAAETEISRIKEWLAGEEKRADQARGYLDFLLEDYHRRELGKNPKQKTIKLPHGELQMRVMQPEFYRDDNSIIAWARENRPEFVVQPPPPDPKLDWAELKKTIQIVDGKVLDPETGEIIPGITVVERPPKFQIKLSEV